MKNFYLTAAIIAAMSTTFVSCSNELDDPTGAVVVDGQTGRVVFNVNTGKSVSFARSTVGEDQVIKTLSVFVFDELGDRVPGVKQDYSPSDMTDNKLAVILPSDQMNKVGFKAYLVANVTPDNCETETALLGFITHTPTTNVSEQGIPMASAPISYNTTTPVVTVEAVMKRTMSSLFVKVNEKELNGEIINSGDFTYKVKNVRVDHGFMFKDGVSTGDATEATWTPKANTNTEELLGYMYQTNGFEVEITPSADKPELGSQSRTVIVAADKAKKRNKKYVLNVLPKVTENGTIDFTVTVEEWDATDGNFNVDWVDNAKLVADLDATKFKIESGKITLLQRVGTYLDYGLIKDWFTTVEEASIHSVEMSDLVDNTRNGVALSDGRVTGNGLNLEDILGKVTLTTKKNDVMAKQEWVIQTEGCRARFGNRNGAEYDTDWETFQASGILKLTRDRSLPNELANVSIRTFSLLEYAEDWEYAGIAANEEFTSNETTSGWVLTYDEEGRSVRFVGRFEDRERNAPIYIKVRKGSEEVIRRFTLRTAMAEIN